jgi:hypothetical protein
VELYLAIGAGLLLATIAFLRVVAPKTKTTKDDEALKQLEKIEPFVKK